LVTWYWEKAAQDWDWDEKRYKKKGKLYFTIFIIIYCIIPSWDFQSKYSLGVFLSVDKSHFTESRFISLSLITSLIRNRKGRGNLIKFYFSTKQLSLL